MLGDMDDVELDEVAHADANDTPAAKVNDSTEAGFMAWSVVVVGADVRRKAEDVKLLSGALCAEELVDHGQCALVMLDHEGQEQAVELRAARAIQLGHLLGGEHAGHEVAHGHPGHGHRVLHLCGRIRRWQLSLGQPPLHEGDLIALRDLDAPRENADALAGTVRRRPARHDHRLRVMTDHSLHEADVGRGIRHDAAVHFRLLGGGARFSLGVRNGGCRGRRGKEQRDDMRSYNGSWHWIPTVRWRTYGDPVPLDRHRQFVS
jgi:hypothetical protein